jgi:hypothetical protein
MTNIVRYYLQKAGELINVNNILKDSKILGIFIKAIQHKAQYLLPSYTFAPQTPLQHERNFICVNTFV